jgi:hypothetical protein
MEIYYRYINLLFQLGPFVDTKHFEDNTYLKPKDVSYQQHSSIHNPAIEVLDFRALYISARGGHVLREVLACMVVWYGGRVAL